MTSKDTAGPRLLTFEDIVNVADTPEEVVDVPEWGGAVRVRGLTKAQQIDVRKRSMLAGEVDPDLVQRNLLREAVVEPAMTEEQITVVWQKSAGAIDRILTRALALSGMGADAVNKAEATFRS